MNVSTEDIKSIPAGAIRLFPCENGAKIKSARSFVLETGLIFAIRAMRKGDTKIL